jgi:hypothetical protein
VGHFVPFSLQLSHRLPPINMPEPQSSSEPTLRAKYQAVFDSALNFYEKKTGKVLSSNPLRRKLETCHSPNDILTALGQQIPESHQSRSDDDVLTKWLTPTVNVINAFSATISRAVGLVSHKRWLTHCMICTLMFILQAYEPAVLIFTAIGVLLAVNISIISLFHAVVTPQSFRQLTTQMPPEARFLIFLGASKTFSGG